MDDLWYVLKEAYLAGVVTEVDSSSPQGLNAERQTSSPNIANEVLV